MVERSWTTSLSDLIEDLTDEISKNPKNSLNIAYALGHVHRMQQLSGGKLELFLGLDGSQFLIIHRGLDGLPEIIAEFFNKKLNNEICWGAYPEVPKIKPPS